VFFPVDHSVLNFGGKLCEHWDVADTKAIFAQIGAIKEYSNSYLLNLRRKSFHKSHGQAV
jgi:hypothetical protein